MLLQLQLYHKMSKLKNVVISSLNVKGLRGNFLYSKYLALASSIVFFCELWTKPNEVNLIKEIANFSGKDFLYKSDMDHMYKRGRPFGGQCWFYEKGFTAEMCNRVEKVTITITITITFQNKKTITITITINF